MATFSKQDEIEKLARKVKWSTAENYKKHISVDAGFEENLLKLLRVASDDQERAIVKRRLKSASFPVQKTLAAFEFNESRLPHLNKDQVLELATCKFIKEYTNILMIGNCGTGKTHAATAIGMEAIRLGYSVKFCRACDLAMQLSEAQSDKRLNGMIKSLHRYDLLVLDELGYMTFDQRSSNLLFQVLAGRYEVRSTIITSNLEFSKWPDFLGDPVMVNALVGRMVQNSAVLNMNGEGYRLRSSKK